MTTLATLYADIRSLILQFAQEKLISGTNIKTVNNESLLGSGNITIQGGGGGSGGSQINDFYGDSSTNELVIDFDNGGSIFHTHIQLQFNFVDGGGTSKKNLVNNISGTIGEHTVSLSDFTEVTSGYAISKACDCSTTSISLSFSIESGYTPSQNGYTSTILPYEAVKTHTTTIILQSAPTPPSFDDIL